VHEIKHDGYRLQVRRDADRSFVSGMKASSAYSRSLPTNHAVLVGDRINQLRRGASAVSAAQ
jgi:ATP-dependent DNA ligase